MSFQANPVLAGAIAAAMLLPSAGQFSDAAANPANPEMQQGTPAASGSTTELVPANQLINWPLQDQQGRDAGRIDGIILNTENGAVDFVIVAGSGNFNLNGQVIAVPWSVLKPPATPRGPITVTVSAGKLAQAPRLDPNVLGRLEEPRMRADVYGYYGYPYRPYYGYRYGPYAPAGRIAAGYGPYGPGGGYPGATQPTANGNQGSSTPPPNQRELNQSQSQLVQNGLVVGANGVVSALQSPATTSATAMRSVPVYAENVPSNGVGGGPRNGDVAGPNNGGSIGQIRQVMIDPQRGEVAYVLLEQGGFLGLKANWHAVPIEALAWAPYQGAHRLTINERLLNNEPSLPANNTNTPVQVPTNQLAQLYQHFGMTPYWEQGSAQSGSNSGNTGASGANSGGSQPPATSR
jgi:sporulation protein YlmC with PRC-barrel domain